MSIRIEVTGEGLSRWLEKKRIQTDTTTTVVLDIPQEGRCETAFGVVGLRFASNRVGNAVAIINCGECKVLQTRSRRGERSVDIRRDGVGKHNLAKGVDLFLYTGENLDQYRAETRAEMQFRQDREGWIKSHI